MSKLGELFKTERQKRNLTLHEIGMSLKINPKILKAIEDNDTPNLPAKTFLRGFVKSYAQYFRFDVNEIMQQFQDEYGTTRPEAPLPPISVSPSSTSTPSVMTTKSLKKAADSALPASTTNKFFPIVGAIFLLIMIAFVAKMMDKYQKESQISKVEVAGTQLPVSTSTTLPLDGAISSTGIQQDPSAVGTSEPSTTPSTLPGAEAPAVLTSTPSTTSISTSTTIAPAGNSTPATDLKSVPPPPMVTTTSTTLKPVTTTTTMKPVVTTTTMVPVTTTTLVKVPVTAPVPVTTTTLKIQNTEIIVEALNRVTLRFSLNGQKWETMELSPDQVHTLRSKTNIQIEVSDGGAINIIVNGHDRGVPGTIGRPMKLSYP